MKNRWVPSRLARVNSNFPRAPPLPSNYARLPPFLLRPLFPLFCFFFYLTIFLFFYIFLLLFYFLLLFLPSLSLSPLSPSFLVKEESDKSKEIDKKKKSRKSRSRASPMLLRPRFWVLTPFSQPYASLWLERNLGNRGELREEGKRDSHGESFHDLSRDHALWGAHSKLVPRGDRDAPSWGGKLRLTFHVKSIR